MAQCSENKWSWQGNFCDNNKITMSCEIIGVFGVEWNSALIRITKTNKWVSQSGMTQGRHNYDWEGNEVDKKTHAVIIKKLLIVRM